MELSKEKFADVIQGIRKVLKTDECAKCSCPNIRCEWHGDCYNCIRIYRHFGMHVPRCLQFVLDKKIAKITKAAENEIQKKPITPDEYYDYLNLVAPKQNSDSDIGIRAAGVEDADFLAWVILTAGRAHVKKGIWEVVLGMSWEQCLHFLKLLSVTIVPHLFHYSCYLLADVDGMPRAGLGGYDPNVSGNTALPQALQEVFQLMESAPPRMSQDGAPHRILGCIPEPVEGVWMIDSVAAVPEFRRQGIVSKLLEAVLAKGRAKGFRRVQINIYIGNTAAQRLYEKHGFAIMDEMRSSYFEAEIGSPGMARMVRDL